jgi:colanic acid biosynthesis glycosyl transferase WcaI
MPKSARFLVIGINYTPETTGIAPYTTGLCEHLTSQGHQVEVITAFPYYPEWRVWDEYRGRPYQRERINNVYVRRVWHLVPSRASNLVQRLAHDFSFAMSIFFAGLFAGRFDVICCVCPPPTLAFTAYILSKIRRRSYVIVLADLASDAAIATGILKEGPVVRMAREVERFVYSSADRVVCICQGFVDKLTARGIAQQKLVLIPLWGDTQQVYPVAGAIEFRRANQLTRQQFLVMYTGNIGKKQDLLNVVRAAELSRDITDLVWLLVGQGEDRSVIEDAIGQRGLKNISILPLQPAEGLAEMYSAADLLLLNQKAAMVDSVIPSKLLTYMAAGRAVLGAVSDKSEAARYIERARCGLIVAPEDPKALLEAVLSLRADPALRERLGADGRAYVQQYLTKEKILKEYDRLFSRYTGGIDVQAEASKNAEAAG